MMDEKRPRGRPRGASGKPYAKRIPKTTGFSEPSAREEELSPKERTQVQEFVLQYDVERQLLTNQAKQGNYVAAQTLFNRFRIMFPPINPLSRVNGNGFGSTHVGSFTLTLGLV